MTARVTSWNEREYRALERRIRERHQPSSREHAIGTALWIVAALVWAGFVAWVWMSAGGSK